MILVISGPGGAGKGTIVERLLAADPRFWLSRSWTTRARRTGEAEDAYHFVDRATFEEAIEQGGFLEWVEFLDYLQGTPVPEPPPDTDPLFEIDVYGAREIQKRFPDAVLVFVEPPTPDVQERRLRARGDSDEVIRRRLEKAPEEARLARELGAHVVVNDDLHQAVHEIQTLVADARAR